MGKKTGYKYLALMTTSLLLSFQTQALPQLSSYSAHCSNESSGVDFDFALNPSQDLPQFYGEISIDETEPIAVFLMAQKDSEDVADLIEQGVPVFFIAEENQSDALGDENGGEYQTKIKFSAHEQSPMDEVVKSLNRMGDLNCSYQTPSAADLASSAEIP